MGLPRLKGVVLYTCVWLLGTAQPVSAHIRWFTTDESIKDISYTLDVISVWVFAGAAMFIALVVWVDLAKQFQAIGDWFEGLWFTSSGIDWRLVSFATGGMLVANVFQDQKVFLAPNLILPHVGFEFFYSLSQFMIGGLLMLQISISISGVMILILTAFTGLLVPFNLLIDYIFQFVTLGFALIFIGPSICQLDRLLIQRFKWGEAEKYEHLALPILRVGVGLTLIILALHNKFLNPGLAVAFLEEHHFNFMPYFGFEEFTNLNFALSAGVAEIVFGVLILFGVAARFVTVSLSVFITLTLFQLPQVELIGHIPLIAIAVLLILRGSGEFNFTARKNRTLGWGRKMYALLD